MITLCLIGVGPRMTELIPAIQLRKDVQIIALVEPNSESRCRWCSNLEVPGFETTDEMLTYHSPTAALMAVPHHCHLGAFTSLSQAGVHVLKEKPLARNLTEALAMVRLCRKHSVVLSVGCQRRHMASFVHGADLMRSFTPRQVNAQYCLATSSPSEGWRGSKHLAGGGCLIDMGYHMIDVLLWYFGLPCEISCRHSGVTTGGVENECELTMQYPSGLEATVLVSRTAAPKREKIIVSGHTQRICVERGVVEVSGSDSESPVTHYSDKGWDRALEIQFNHFVLAVQGGRASTAYAEAHLEHMAVIEAAYTSADTGRPIDPRRLLEQMR